MHNTVRFLVPEGVDDQQRPSGGNRYDLELARELGDLGYEVHLAQVSGTWPRPSAGELSKLSQLVETISEGETVLWDGLIACGVPGIVHEASKRLRQVVLVHLPLADETGLAPEVAGRLDKFEGHALHLADAVVATSRWTADKITAHHGLPGVRVHVAPPGVHLAPLAPGTLSGGRNLLSVGSISPRKQHNLVVEALAQTPRDLPWHLKIAGAQPDAAYADQLHHLIAEAGLGDRISFLGPLAGPELDAAYAEADLLVHCPVKEPWGMVITFTDHSAGVRVPRSRAFNGHAVPINRLPSLSTACDVDRVGRRRWRGVGWSLGTCGYRCSRGPVAAGRTPSCGLIARSTRKLTRI